MTTQTNATFIQPSDRIASFKPYFFAALNLKINRLRGAGVNVTRLDMGSPDLPPAPFIVDALVESARKPSTHGYAQIGGAPNFKKAVTEYYHHRHEVDLDPQTEVLTLLGSKEGLFNLSQVLLNPGDVAIVPDPGYPVYAASGTIAGAEIYAMPLLEKNNFLPDLDAIPADIARRAKILWLNYPNNPTGAVASLEFFKKAVDFAYKHQIVIANDAPYMDICFDGYRAPSILEVEGAKEVSIEFNSLSKTYNMAGWRLGYCVGNTQMIGGLAKIKGYYDYGIFSAIQVAGIVAMRVCDDNIVEQVAVYQKRRDVLCDGLVKMGWEVEVPKAGMFLWVKIPEPYIRMGSIKFSIEMMERANVAVAPGAGFGVEGEGYLRLALVENENRMTQALKQMRRALKEIDGEVAAGTFQLTP